MIVFKIIATVLNYKKAKNHLIKKVFSIDEKFIHELKQLKNITLSDSYSKNLDNGDQLNELNKNNLSLNLENSNISIVKKIENLRLVNPNIISHENNEELYE